MENKSPQKFYGQTLSAKCVLVSPERFCAQLGAFSNEAIAIFKTIPSRSYDPKNRVWSFSIKHYNLLMSTLGKLPNFLIEKLPPFVLKCLNIPENDVEIDFDKLDPVLSSSLMPFQLEGLKFGIDKNGRCFIADDMGLGKTFQGLAIANYYMNDWPMLIVTTASMKVVWEKTITNYLPSVSIMTVQYMVSAKDYIGDAKILIVSHDMMSRCLNKLLEKQFGVVIIDESHTLKNFKSKCFQSAMTLCKRAKRVVLLSGTPALSRPSELYTQLSLIDDKFFGNFFDFSRRYCDAKTSHFGWDASGKSNLEELEIILSKKFMIRRTKEQVLKFLPNKTQEVILLNTDLNDLPQETKKGLVALGDKYKSKNKSIEKHAALLLFFSETAKIKIPSVCLYILQVLETKVKFLVFAHHQVMLNAIEDLMHSKNVKYIRIDGSISSQQRNYFISKFQADNSYKCAILSITAASAGITLTAANLILFAELHWNPSILSQAEARAHRIGQGDTVTVRYLLAEQTADDLIWPLLEDKQRTLNQVGLSKDSFDGIIFRKQTSVDLNIDNESSISSQKKRKIDEVEVDTFNDGMDKLLCEHSNIEDVLNDGLDDLFCSIDF